MLIHDLSYSQSLAFRTEWHGCLNRNFKTIFKKVWFYFAALLKNVYRSEKDSMKPDETVSLISIWKQERIVVFSKFMKLCSSPE